MDDQKGIAELGGYELWGQGTPALIFWGVSILMVCSSVIFIINDDFGTFILCFFGAGISGFIFYLFDKSYFEKCYQKGLEIKLEEAGTPKYNPIPLTAQYEEKKRSWITLASQEWKVPESEVESYFQSLETGGKAWWLNKELYQGSHKADIFKETKISYLVSKQDWNALAELKAVDAIIKVLDVLLNNEAIFEEDRGQGWGMFHWKTDGNNGNRGTKIFGALGKIGDTKAMNFLIECLQNKAETVRLAATKALGKTGNMSAVEPLIKALEDEDKSVRRAATYALDELGWNPN